MDESTNPAISPEGHALIAEGRVYEEAALAAQPAPVSAAPVTVDRNAVLEEAAKRLELLAPNEYAKPAAIRALKDAAPASVPPTNLPERDQSKPAEQQGLFRKFDVRRVDGSDQPGGKHYGCRYYALDLDHDQHAPAAMRTYAVECAVTHPLLSADLAAEFGGVPQPTATGPAAFKNFHRALCERFNYTHDEQFWWRDQVSLIEHIVAGEPQPHAQGEADDQRDAALYRELNTPEIPNFIKGVEREALHQRDRWGSAHDGGKAPEDWFWLLGYLGGKALHAAKTGNNDKALHHTISSAAALLNWHAAILGTHTSMRPGIAIPAEQSADKPAEGKS